MPSMIWPISRHRALCSAKWGKNVFKRGLLIDKKSVNGVKKESKQDKEVSPLSNLHNDGGNSRNPEIWDNPKPASFTTSYLFLGSPRVFKWPEQLARYSWPKQI